MAEYCFTSDLSIEEFKQIRKKLGFTQKEFAHLIGSSKPTLERWESGSGQISGPAAILVSLLAEHQELLIEFEVPKQELPIRMWYMYKNRCCTMIDVDDKTEKVKIKNFTDNTLFQAFGREKQPTYADYLDFLKSRCFPETRDKMKIELQRLGIPFYDPFLIIKKTQGRMAEDDFWIRMEGPAI